MRETKFRGKVIGKQEELEAMGVIDKNGWATGNLIQNDQHTMIVGDLLEFDDEDMMCDWWVPVIPETVEQIKADINENQQIVLNGLKEFYAVNHSSIATLYELHKKNMQTDSKTVEIWKAYRELSTFEGFQVMQAFAEWGLGYEKI